ncbi:MAG: flagellar basal body rod C-terminal domain-containing protein, partial [Candidatus Contubernalis sp.]|nr:flagellar basal body rod C-terminal domain-containing protein [Candidatus Contubernalis sp.]
IVRDLKLVAASTYDIEGANPGDGSNALAIAKLRYSRIDTSPDPDDPHNIKVRIKLDLNGVSTFENFYRDSIARMGVDAQESQHMAENQAALIGLMNKRRDSISGVSLDEELANMVQFQLAYQASARLITTLNEIYDTIINRM